MDPLRYGIVGGGAIGGYYGGMLHRAGADVRFLLRSDYEHVCLHGLTIRSAEGEFTVAAKAHARAADMPPCDVAVIAIKGGANDVLREVLPRILAPRGVALILQNGLHPEQPAIEILGAERVVGGACYIGCNKLGPGLIQHVCYGKIALGAYVASAKLSRIMERMRADFDAAKFGGEVTGDLRRVRWSKLVWNTPYNGMTTLFDCATDVLMNDPRTRRMIRCLMLDVIASARACGIPLEDAYADELLVFTDKMAPYTTSMQLDRRAGRPLEADPIVGQPLRAARAAGFEPPWVAALYAALVQLGDSGAENMRLSALRNFEARAGALLNA